MGSERAPRRDAPLFVATIGLSALLLFTLELVAGRLVLPVFGGAPSVWTTALCFYSGIVLAGYAYAHLVATRLGRVGGMAHVGLAVAVVVAALAAPADVSTLRITGMPPALNVLIALAALSGAAAFLFSTTTPLLSSWYARGGADPWWLYAVSNAASLGGLLAYPFLIEPLVPLSTQRVLLTGLIGVLAVLLAAVVLRSRETMQAPITRAESESVTAAEEAPAARPTLKRQAMWVFAASVPAGLLSATTTHLATDHTSTPLLWIGPLGVYLASFVVAFSGRGRRSLPAFERLVPAAATLMWLPYVGANWGWPVLVLVPMMLAAFAVLAVAIHGRLALDRPGAPDLTRFYLLVSLGGLLATGFVALVAPLVFTSVYEFPVLLVAGLVALALLPGPTPAEQPKGLRPLLREAALRLGPFVAAAAVLVVVLAPGPRTLLLLVEFLLVIGATVIAVTRSAAMLAVGTSVAIVALTLYLSPPPLLRTRTFFGITEVAVESDGSAITEYSGTTLHGLQLRASPEEPTSYYGRSGPFGDVARVMEARRPRGASIGIVGLGVGTLAAYARPEDEMTYLEIDPEVARLAKDTRYFTYLSNAPVPVRVVIGDGRLSLADGPADAYDVLVLDAFSSDAVPAHLLTREAMGVYGRALKPGGIVVFHMTNRRFDLAPAVAATARAEGLDALVREYTPDAEAKRSASAAPSVWLVAGAPDDVEPFRELGWREPSGGRVFTDDFADVMWLLRR